MNKNRHEFVGNNQARMEKLRQHLLGMAQQKAPLAELLLEAALVARREDLPVEAAKIMARGIAGQESA